MKDKVDTNLKYPITDQVWV